MSKIKSFFSGRDEYCLKVLLFILPFGLATVQHYGSTLFLFMSAIVVAGLCFKKINIRAIFLKYRFVFCSIVLLYLATIVSFVNVSDLEDSFKKLGKISYLLMIIPCLIYFVNHDYSKFFKLGIYLSAPLNFIVAIFAIFYQGLDRAQGFYHPIIYGDIMILFGSILLLEFVNMKDFNKYHFFEIVFVMFYFIAALLSGSRGAIFSLPIIVFAIIIMSNLSIKFKTVLTTTLAGIAIFVIISISFIPYGKYQFVDRINSTGTNIAKYIQGENKNSSLGQRLMMWEISVDIFKNQPIIGTGLGDFQSEVKSRMERKETDLLNAWSHAHSIYFNFLATTGLFGLLSLFMVFLSPLSLIRNLPGNIYIGDLKFLGVSILSFMMFGLTEDWFSRSVLVIAFVISFVVFSSASRQPE